MLSCLSLFSFQLPCYTVFQCSQLALSASSDHNLPRYFHQLDKHAEKKHLANKEHFDVAHVIRRKRYVSLDSFKQFQKTKATIPSICPVGGKNLKSSLRYFQKSRTSY